MSTSHDDDPILDDMDPEEEEFLAEVMEDEEVLQRIQEREDDATDAENEELYPNNIVRPMDEHEKERI